MSAGFYVFLCIVAVGIVVLVVTSRGKVNGGVFKPEYMVFKIDTATDGAKFYTIAARDIGDGPACVLWIAREHCTHAGRYQVVMLIGPEYVSERKEPG